MSEKKPEYKTKAQTIFRVAKNPDNPFVMMDRRPLEKNTLSWGAKGLLAYLLSRPDNWTVHFKDLVKRSTDGGHKVRGFMKELRGAGHVQIIVQRDEGRITGWEYKVFEIAPDDDFQQVEKQQVINRTFNNKESSLTKKKVKDIGANAPGLEKLPIEWQIAAGVDEVIVPDNTQALRNDAANLIASGFGSKSAAAFELVMAFQNEKNITFTESDIKGQRKAVKALIEKNAQPNHVVAAVKKLQAAKMTFADLFGVIKTVTDLLSQPEPDKVRLL